MSIRHPGLVGALEKPGREGYRTLYLRDARWRHWLHVLERTVEEVERACAIEALPVDVCARIVTRVIDAHLPDLRTRAERECAMTQTIDLDRARIPDELKGLLP